MTLSAEDRFVVTDLISMHGHLVDSGELDRLGELFTEDVVYDLTDFDVVLTRLGSGEVHALSKGIGVRADGTTGSVTYEDVAVRTDEGWRIRFRKVLARRAPLGRT
ncbi:polyketide cyclase [Streptomyces sp. AcH 505]|uniref:nuclear transport factor 2 family protein n=1 Tax=Streptomyces sp. AcH 505 TaxID=352211 RepID=UPI00059195E6|nr:polyketide cyclase [Streptomyces sp. AcH 505]